MATTTAAGKPHEPARYPRATIRLRYGRKMLRHGLALGWRAEWDGEPFPVTVTTIAGRTILPTHRTTDQPTDR